MIESRFDVPLIADLALREKQIQQNYRPPIAVHKWFARRPGTLFRGLLLSEFVDRPLRESFYASNNLPGIRVADPFMGGGTPLMEANRVGCDVVGFDINPMAYWIVRQEIEHVDLKAYAAEAGRLRNALERDVGHLYRTKCLVCGRTDAHVKYFLWVKTATCGCGKDIRLFPGYLVAEDRRHPKNVLFCPYCDHLTETADRRHPGSCTHCGKPLSVSGPAHHGRLSCPACAAQVRFPDPSKGPLRHSLFAIEYHCPCCRPLHKGRFFKTPDASDISKIEEADTTWRRMRPRYVPDDEIPAGDETDRLHRWGYRHYNEMFNARQLIGLELSCRSIAQVGDKRIAGALATNLSDLLRYQNMLCRYDSMALKSLDIFSVHGFPVGLIQCESNLLGIPADGGQGNIGSGGWSNIVDKFTRAKAFCSKPFEYRHVGSGKERVDLDGEWIGDEPNGREMATPRTVLLECGDAATQEFLPHSLDAVLTDPPYFGNVQYAELMDFCYVWLRRVVEDSHRSRAFKSRTTRNAEELTGNLSMGRDLQHFTHGMSAVFTRMAQALKPGGPLAFTYHHNALEAYYPVAVAILDAGLACSASIPCPGEMGASIHISGTGSSIIDTVFVCRSTGNVLRSLIASAPAAIAGMVRADIASLAQGDIRLTAGDIKCIAFGHMTRLAVWFLRPSWDRTLPVARRLVAVTNWVNDRLRGGAAVMDALRQDVACVPRCQPFLVREEGKSYGRPKGTISF